MANNNDSIVKLTSVLRPIIHDSVKAATLGITDKVAQMDTLIASLQLGETAMDALHTYRQRESADIATLHARLDDITEKQRTLQYKLDQLLARPVVDNSAVVRGLTEVNRDMNWTCRTLINICDNLGVTTIARQTARDTVISANRSTDDDVSLQADDDFIPDCD